MNDREYREGETIEAYVAICVPLTFRAGEWRYEGGAYTDPEGAPWVFCGSSAECYSEAHDWFRDEAALEVADFAVTCKLQAGERQ